MAALANADRLEWVDCRRRRCGAEGRLYNPQRPFTPRWLLRVVQRPLGRIASTPAVGQLETVDVATEMSGKRSFARARRSSGGGESAAASTPVGIGEGVYSGTDPDGLPVYVFPPIVVTGRR